MRPSKLDDVYVLSRNSYGDITVNALTYTYTRKHFSDVMLLVNDDHVPVIVTDKHGKHVVIISLEDYQSLEETAYLLRNQTGAQRLLESVEELRKGGGTERDY